VRDALDKDLKMELDLGSLGDMKVDLNLDLEGLLQNLDDLDDVLKDGGGRKELDRARAQLKRAMEQVDRAKMQFQRAQAALQTAQARLAEMEAKTKLADEVDKEKIMKKAKVLRDLTDRSKEAGDKADWKAKEKADKAARDFTKEKSRTDRSKHDDELEKRFERMMREMEQLGRELKRRRSEDKSSPDKPQGN